MLFFVKLKVLGLRLGVDFALTLDNNHNDNNDNDNNNPHLYFFKGTVQGVNPILPGGGGSKCPDQFLFAIAIFF